MVFYSCLKCQRLWQYKIAKCPECLLPLAKGKGGRVKVIGVSRVSIPTALNPVVPYFVLLLQDETGNRWAQKSIREYQIGEEFRIETTADLRAVAIWRVKYDLPEVVEKLTEVLSFPWPRLNRQSKILILPDLSAPQHPHFRENTSPEFLEAILELLIQRGASKEKIKIAGQSFNQFDIGLCAAKSQLLDVCRKFEITSLNLATENFVKKGDLEIWSEVFAADFIFNLPILKSGKAEAAENLLRLLRRENYLNLEYLQSKEGTLGSLLKILPPVLTLAEAEMIQRRDKNTAYLGLALASFSALNLDRVFYEIIMEKNFPAILKEIEVGEIPVAGRQISEVQFAIERV